MSGKTNAQKPQQDQDATSVASENVSEGQSLSGYEAEEDVQLATAEAYRNIAPRKSILKSKEESEYSPKARIRKLLSVAIACCCSYPDCDCTELKVIDLINVLMVKAAEKIKLLSMWNTLKSH